MLLQASRSKLRINVLHSSRRLVTHRRGIVARLSKSSRLAVTRQRCARLAERGAIVPNKKRPKRTAWALFGGALVDQIVYQFFDFQPAFALTLPVAAGAVVARLKLPNEFAWPASRVVFTGSW
jgi:hypothetical protein